MTQQHETCELCNELRTGKIPPHPDWGSEQLSRRLMARWGGLNVVSALVPIVAGHMLVFPDEHVWPSLTCHRSGEWNFSDSRWTSWSSYTP